MPDKNTSISYFFAGLTVFFWSTVATAFKLALIQLSFLQLLLISVITSTVVLFMIIVVTGNTNSLIRVNKKYLFNSSVLGFLNPYLYYILVFKAYSLLPAQIAQPLNFIWPVMLVILSIPFLKQKINIRGLIALLISFAGVLLISSQGHIGYFRIEQPLGVFLALISSVVWATFWIVNLRITTNNRIQLFYNFLFASAYIFITCAITGNISIPLHFSSLIAVYVGLFEMGITFLFWLKALQLAESTAKISNLIYLTPFLSLIFIHLILKENIYWTSVTGLVLIITGIILQKTNPVKT